MSVETLTKKYTLAEYEALPDDGKKYELVEGELVEMPGASEEHSRISTTIQGYLWNFVLANKLGEVYNSDARYALEPYSDIVRMADVSFVQTSRVTRGVVTMKFGPDLVGEVLSESNSVTDIEKKTKEYRQAGSRLVWVINPEEKEVYIYRAGELQRQTLTVEEELDGEQVLPGFKLPVGKLFE
jgi:Uma2 family endonuclease